MLEDMASPTSANTDSKGRTLARRLARTFFALWILGSVACVLYEFNSWSWSLQPTASVAPPPGADDADAKEPIKEVYTRRLDSYREGRDRMKTSLQWQALCVTLTILLLGKGVREINPGMVELSQRVVGTIPFILPFVLLYLWMDFGYLYHQLINNRLVLQSMCDVIEAKVPSDWRSNHLLSDQLSVVDLWDLLFQGGISTPRQIPDKEGMWPLYLVKSVLFMIFFGIMHACLFLPYLKWLWKDGRARKPLALWSAFIACIIIAVPTLSTHIEFGVVGHKPNWAQLAIFLLSFLTLPLLVRHLPLRLWRLSRRKNEGAARNPTS